MRLLQRNSGSQGRQKSTHRRLQRLRGEGFQSLPKLLKINY